MKLWVDDIRNAPDDSWTVARTVTSAIKCIHMFGMDIEVISLDHDISYPLEFNGVVRPYPSPETFQAVAMYMDEHYAVPNAHRPHVIIHSANPVGSDELKAILHDFAVEGKLEYKPMGIANRLEQEV